MVNTLTCGAEGQRFDPGQHQVFFSYFIKILVFPLYFASMTSSISMLMLDYPLRVIQKRLKAVIQNFLRYYQISSLLGFVD